MKYRKNAFSGTPKKDTPKILTDFWGTPKYPYRQKISIKNTFAGTPKKDTPKNTTAHKKINNIKAFSKTKGKTV